MHPLGDFDALELLSVWSLVGCTWKSQDRHASEDGFSEAIGAAMRDEQNDCGMFEDGWLRCPLDQEKASLVDVILRRIVISNDYKSGWSL